MSEEKPRRSYAVDDVTEIARHMKRIKEEEAAAREEQPAVSLTGPWDKMTPGIYTDEFWQQLIDAGILTVGEA